MKKSKEKDTTPKKRNPMFWGGITISGLLLSVSALGLWLTSEEKPNGPLVTVYKSATCGCCKKWIKHMEYAGFNVKAIDVRNLDKVKKEYEIAKDHQSCHTALINGYVVEGHVPIPDIKRLISEKPKIKGLVVPGMPMGSPGMEGPRVEHYEVLSIDQNNHSTVFNTYN